jgi:hypothetical protein
VMSRVTRYLVAAANDRFHLFPLVDPRQHASLTPKPRPIKQRGTNHRLWPRRLQPPAGSPRHRPIRR